MFLALVASDEHGPLLVVPGAHPTQRRVPSCENLYPDVFVASATGLYMRNPRKRPSKPGTENPLVTITLVRCGMVLPSLSTTVVFDSETPSMSSAPARFTVPMMGLVTWNSLSGPYGRLAVGAVLNSA